VTPSARSAGGFRLYTESDIKRLLIIRRMKPLDFTLSEMSQLLDSLDVLDSPAASSGERAAAAAFVAGCHRRAQESCTRLAGQLAYAEELTEVLAAQSQNQGATAPTPR
jgi:MerR family copper efflux transcriptional regulator